MPNLANMVEPPVIDLLNLKLREGVGVVCEAEGVEHLSGVQDVEALAEGSTGHAVGLNETHEHHLAAKDGEDGLGVAEAGVAEVVEAALREDLGASLEPGHVVGGLERLGDDAARGAEHDPASVDRC